MKKITFIFTLLTSLWGYSQTYSLYTEDATVSSGNGVPTFFNNVNGFSEATSDTPYEGTSARKFVFDNTSSWFMGQILHSNTTYGAQDLSSFSHYNIALKTSSTSSFFIRLKGNDVTAKILFTAGSDPYGFSRDGEWHFMSIPVEDFVPESSDFNFSSVTELFVLRSDGTIDSVNNDFEIDNFYMSSSEVLSLDNIEATSIGLALSANGDSISVISTNTIDFVTIYNIAGQKLLSSKKSENLNISPFKSGLYIINASVNGKNITSKFIKE